MDRAISAHRTGSGSLARLTAIPATLRLVLEAFLSVELLVANGENEISTAVFTGDVLVFQRKRASG